MNEFFSWDSLFWRINLAKVANAMETTFIFDAHILLKLVNILNKLQWKGT